MQCKQFKQNVNSVQAVYNPVLPPYLMFLFCFESHLVVPLATLLGKHSGYKIDKILLFKREWHCGMYHGIVIYHIVIHVFISQ